MPNYPRELKAPSGVKSELPGEWNKIVGCLKELGAIGAFDQSAGLAPLRIATFKLTEPMYYGMDGGKQGKRILSSF